MFSLNPLEDVCVEDFRKELSVEELIVATAKLQETTDALCREQRKLMKLLKGSGFDRPNYSQVSWIETQQQTTELHVLRVRLHKAMAAIAEADLSVSQALTGRSLYGMHQGDIET